MARVPVRFRKQQKSGKKKKKKKDIKEILDPFVLWYDVFFVDVLYEIDENCFFLSFFFFACMQSCFEKKKVIFLETCKKNTIKKKEEETYLRMSRSAIFNSLYYF